MLLFNYQKTIDLHVLCDYYASLKSNDFRFVPEQDSWRLLSRLGLKFQPVDAGFSLFAEVDNAGKLVNEQAPTPVKMVFFMVLNNPSFVNFTNLPLTQDPSKIYYFSNRAANKREVFGVGSDSLLLNQNEQTSSSDLIKKIGDTYHFIVDGNDGNKTAELFSLDSNEMVLTKDLDPTNGHYNIFFMLSGLRAGRYQLKFDGAEVDRFYYAPQFSGGKYFAVIELFSSTDTDYAYFDGSNVVTFKDYGIAFKHRDTLWRYKVMNRNGLNLPNPGIKETETPWEFTDSGDLVFVSNGPMPLKEAPIHGIAFYNDKNDASSILISDLPNPGTTLIKPEPADPATIYSDIYIYL